MGRTAKSKELKSAEDGFNPQRVAEAEQATQELAKLQPVMDEVLALGVDLGRFEALDFVATVATHHLLVVYDNVKKSGAWKLLRNPAYGDGRHFESLEDFCEVKLGKSYRRMRELAANRNAIGQEAYEQAEKIGIRQSDYNAIKALPAQKQAMIKEALAEGANLETVTRVLRQLAAEDQREIEALTHRAEDAEADLEASRARVAAKETETERLTKELARAKQRVAKESPDEAEAGLREEVNLEAFAAGAVIAGRLRPSIKALIDHGREHDRSHEEFIVGLLCQIEREVSVIRNECGLKAVPDGDEVPSWARPDADAVQAKKLNEIKAGIAKGNGVGHA